MGFKNSIVAGVTLIREAIQSRDFQTGVAGWRIARDGTAEFLDVIIRGLITATDIQAGPLPNFTVDGDTGIVTFQGSVKRVQVVPSGSITGNPDIRFFSEDLTDFAYINQPSTEEDKASIGMNSSDFTPADGIARRIRLFLNPTSEHGRLQVIRDSTQVTKGGSVLVSPDEVFIEYQDDDDVKYRWMLVNEDGIFFYGNIFTDAIWELQVRGILRMYGADNANLIVESGASAEFDAGSTLTFDPGATSDGLIQGYARRKTANTVHNNTTTFVNDPDLRVDNLPANSRWAIQVWVRWTGVSVNSDVKFDLSLPAGAFKTWSSFGQPTGNTTTVGTIDTGVTTGAHARAAINGQMACILTGHVTIAGTGGTLIFQHAPNVAVAENLTVSAESYMTLTKLP